MLIALACVSIWAVVLNNGMILGLLCLIGLLLSLSAIFTGRLRGALLVAVVMVVWATMVGQGFFYELAPRTALWTLIPPSELGPLHLPGLVLYREGLLHGLKQSLRFSAVLLIGASASAYLGPDGMLKGFQTLRAPPGLAFLTITALRSIPTLLEELRIIRMIRRQRGYRPFRLGLGATLSMELAVLRPLLAKTLRRADALAASLSYRSFQPQVARAGTLAVPLSGVDRLAMALLVAVTVLLTVARGLVVLYVHGILYLPPLRDLYGWMRAYL